MKPRIQVGELSRVRDRSKGIDQDALPLDVDPSDLGGGEDVVTSRAQKSIDWAHCPHHRHDGAGAKGGMTGLIALDNKTLAFRDHSKKVGKVTVPCPGSGLIYTPPKGLNG